MNTRVSHDQHSTTSFFPHLLFPFILSSGLLVHFFSGAEKGNFQEQMDKFLPKNEVSMFVRFVEMSPELFFSNIRLSEVNAAVFALQVLFGGVAWLHHHQQQQQQQEVQVQVTPTVASISIRYKLRVQVQGQGQLRTSQSVSVSVDRT